MMIAIVPPAGVRQMDADAIASGTPGVELMRRAAQAVALRAREMAQGRRVLILCGGGNNGGDGLMAAMLLRDLSPRVYLWADPAKLRGDAALAYEELDPRLLTDAFCPDENTLVLDALFGTGLDRPLTGEALALVQTLNASHAKVLSVDIPSGVDGRTGKVMGDAVRADVTTTFAVLKPGLLFYPGRTLAGSVEVAHIGLPVPSDAWISLEDQDAAALLPHRNPDSHKGTYGHLAVLAGSPGMMGAGALATASALRSGAGMVSWAFSAGMEPRGLWEVMTRPVLPGEEAQLSAFLQGKSAVVVGPGLGTHGADFLPAALEAKLPAVVDADGLNALCGHPENLLGVRGILTPHPGEAARLLHSTVAEITADPVAACRELARLTGMVALVKGAVTVTCDGKRIALNTNGNAGMATAGSGDVLSGILGSLLAQGMEPWEAALAGVRLHAAAGDRAARQQGMAGMIASDMIRHLPNLIRDWIEIPQTSHESEDIP